jgi:hypothetical protein
MFQRHRVPLFIESPLEEVKQLVGELDPRGVAIRTGGWDSTEQAEALIEWRDDVFVR